MPAFPRSELEEMVERWLQVNREAEAKGVLLRPFLYPGHRPAAVRHRAVVLANPGAGSYRELPPVDTGERLALMQRTLKPQFTDPQLLVFAADHGVAVEGLVPDGTPHTHERVEQLLTSRLDRKSVV